MFINSVNGKSQLKALILLALLSCPSVAAETHAPNIVIILVDDMGYGDPGCYNPKSKIPTPHIDSLACEGMRFTDAHTSGPLCHPSRYGLMTERFVFRTNVSVWPKHIKPSPDDPESQLYNLADDPGETKNLYAERPKIMTRLKSKMKKIVDAGRTRPVAKSHAPQLSEAMPATKALLKTTSLNPSLTRNNNSMKN